MKNLLLFLTLVCFPNFVFSQTIQVGSTFGLSNYQGDIASSKIWSLQELNPAMGIFLRYKTSNEKWAIRTHFLFTRLSGDDNNFAKKEAWRANRNLAFETPIREGSINVQWSFLNKPIPQRGFHPYLFVGFGVVFTNPKTNIDDSDFSENQEKLHSKNHLVIPIGGGFYWDFNDRLTVGLEVSVRQPFTDYLDGISLLGNAQKKDWYTYGGVTFAYEFGEDWEVNKRSRKFHEK